MQILGICSALAVTVQMKPAIVMALSVAVVTGFSSMVMSCLRKGVPSRIRIIVQLVVIAALVILVDQILKAYVYEAVSYTHLWNGLIHLPMRITRLPGLADRCASELFDS